MSQGSSPAFMPGPKNARRAPLGNGSAAAVGKAEAEAHASARASLQQDNWSLTQDLHTCKKKLKAALQRIEDMEREVDEGAGRQRAKAAAAFSGVQMLLEAMQPSADGSVTQRELDEWREEVRSGVARGHEPEDEVVPSLASLLGRMAITVSMNGDGAEIPKRGVAEDDGKATRRSMNKTQERRLELQLQQAILERDTLAGYVKEYRTQLSAAQSALAVQEARVDQAEADRAALMDRLARSSRHGSTENEAAASPVQFVPSGSSSEIDVRQLREEATRLLAAVHAADLRHQEDVSSISLWQDMALDLASHVQSLKADLEDGLHSLECTTAELEISVPSKLEMARQALGRAHDLRSELAVAHHENAGLKAMYESLLLRHEVAEKQSQRQQAVAERLLMEETEARLMAQQREATAMLFAGSQADADGGMAGDDNLVPLSDGRGEVLAASGSWEAHEEAHEEEPSAFLHGIPTMVGEGSLSDGIEEEEWAGANEGGYASSTAD